MAKDFLFTTKAGLGPLHCILVPGLVPDGPETYLRQQGVLRRFGPTTTVTYPYEHFSFDQALARLRATIGDVRASGKKPVLIGTSVGGGLVLTLLRRARDAGDDLGLHGLVLLSPLVSIDDLAPLLKRLIGPIVAEAAKPGGTPEKALDRGRQFFRTLAARSMTGKEPEGGLKQVLALLTPSGIREFNERRIRKRIEKTLSGVPDAGGIERVVSLTQLAGLEPNDKKPLSEVPTLLLWGSKERHTLDMDGPGNRVLCRPDLAIKVFPNVEVHWLYDRDGDEVPHASLLKHAHVYNVHLKRFLTRRRKAAGEPKATKAD